MINYVMPVVGATGRFVLKPPFADKAPADVVFTCESVRSIKDYIAINQDTFEEIYKPVGLQEADYEEAIQNEIPIVSLQSATGQWVYIPADYIEIYPVVDGVIYRQMMIGVSTPPVDSSVNMDDLQTKIAALARDHIGRECAVSVMEISQPIMLSQAKHEAEKALRDANLAITPPALAVIRSQNALIDAQAARIAALEQWILAHQP